MNTTAEAGRVAGSFDGVYRANVAVVIAFFARRCSEPQTVADLTTSATPPAYAVTDNHNGTVTLMIRQFADRANRVAVNRELAQLGVRARVVPVQQGCPALNMTWRYLQPSTQPWSTSPQVQQDTVGGWTVGLIPSRIPAGHTLVFALGRVTNGWEMSDAIVDGHGPNCASGYTSSLTH